MFLIITIQERPGTATSRLSHHTLDKITETPSEEPVTNPPQSKLIFYATFICAIIALSSFSALLFLVPFIVDPALATLTSDFVEQPTECVVVHSKYILGR